MKKRKILKICKLCKNPINENEDRYVHVEDFDKGKFQAEMWAHLPCFNKSMNRELTDLEKQAKVMLNRASKLMSWLPQPTEQFEIK